MVLRSAGLGSVLFDCQQIVPFSRQPGIAYLRAAKRHAGGVATANLAEMAKSARKRVDLAANILDYLAVRREVEESRDL